MKMKKLMSILLAGCMAFSLTACGSKDNSGDTGSINADASTGNDTTVSADAGELTYWSMWNNTEPQAKVIKEAIDAYTAETGIKVNVEWKGRDLGTVLQSALEAGEKIDFFDWDYQKIALEYADKVLNLEDMAKAVNYDDFAIKALPASVRRWAGSLVTIP